MSTDQTPLNEPSVLDYLKDKLRFWKRGEKISLPPEGEDLSQPQAVAQVEAAAPVTSTEKSRPAGLPWRSLVALALALLGQRAWEPAADRTSTQGLVLYFIALAFLIWAIVRREWTLTALPATGTGVDPMRVRPVPLILGLIFSFLAFITLKDNLFTLLNVSIWLLAVFFFAWAFWLPSLQARPSAWKRLRDLFLRGSWQILLTRWGLLVLLVAGVVVFFRVYNVSGVPSEPFSDQAEKILDVYDVSQGVTRIFFPRNTGREALQMYLTLAVSWIFQTGLSFLSLKIGTVICGLLTLPYMYLLGKEYGGRRIGLLVLFFVGIAYWPNVISRVGLRFPLYPLFTAPVLYYLLRGLRTRSRNDMIIAGLFLGLGLHGYSPFRIVPIVVVIAVGLYLLHPQSKGGRMQAAAWLVILALVSLIVFLPLLRFWLDNPALFSFRAFSRLSGVENPLTAPAGKIFLSNLWNGLRMFNWDDGEIWVHSVPHRPALDVISGALFLIGVVLVLARYIRRRHWQDLFLLLAVPLLQLPSTLSLAYPGENPALNRAGGAIVPVFLLVALALDGLMRRLEAPAGTSGDGASAPTGGRVRTALAWGLALCLMVPSAVQNHTLVFDKYATQFSEGAWNSSEMGEVIQQFGVTYGTTDTVWIVPFPYWVDTRLPGVWAGIPNRDFAVWPDQFAGTLPVPGAKLFLLYVHDADNVEALQSLYPQGVLSTFQSATGNADKDFLIFFVPPAQ